MVLFNTPETLAAFITNNMYFSLLENVDSVAAIPEVAVSTDFNSVIFMLISNLHLINKFSESEFT